MADQNEVVNLRAAADARLADRRAVNASMPVATSQYMAAVNRYLEVTGFRAAQQSSADLDVIAHMTDAVKGWVKMQKTMGLKGALTERDRAFAKK